MARWQVSDAKKVKETSLSRLLNSVKLVIKKKRVNMTLTLHFGAGTGTLTRDLILGKDAL